MLYATSALQPWPGCRPETENKEEAIFRRVLTGVEPRMLLHVGQLLEAAVAVGAFVWLLTSVDPDVLHQLVVGGEGL